MKLSKKHYIILSLLVIMLLMFTTSYAQSPFDDIGFPDDVNDETPAPINGLIAVGLAIGGYLGIKKVKS